MILLERPPQHMLYKVNPTCTNQKPTEKHNQENLFTCKLWLCIPFPFIWYLYFMEAWSTWARQPTHNHPTTHTQKKNPILLWSLKLVPDWFLA